MTGRVRFGWPLRLDARGRTRAVDTEEYLRGLVEAVLFTRPGERMNRPEFGSGVAGLIFAPTGDELAAATQALVHGSLQRWLGDLVQVDDVEVAADDAVLTVTVTYTPLPDIAATPTAMVAAPGGRRSVTVSGPAGGRS